MIAGFHGGATTICAGAACLNGWALAAPVVRRGVSLWSLEIEKWWWAGGMGMAYGEHLKVNRGIYWHHFIDLGDGTAVHLWAPSKGAGANVCRSTIREFVRSGERVERVVYQRTVHAPQEIVRRALARVGHRGYDLFFGNCEHFATWCVTGEARSEQVRGYAILASIIGGVWVLSRTD